MRPSTFAGILAGLLVAAVAVVAAVVLLPDVPPATAAGSPAASATPSPAATLALPSPSDASTTPPPMIGDGPPPGSPGTGAASSSLPGVPSSSGPGQSLSPPPAPSPTPIPGVGLAVGQQAPDLVVEKLGGSGSIDLADLRGKPVWVVFMATWCPSCQDELPLLESYHRQLGTRLAIVLVDVREEPATVAAFAKAMKLDVPIGLDQGGSAQHAWSAYALPIHYWLDGDGIVRAVAYGGVGPEQMRPNIQAVAPGASLTP
jgi:cytochrome c biogenesis protein CcmG/thiol:disulfide interchange protein DsbE